MKNFKLVILDYAKEQMDNPLVQPLLSDLFMVRQKNFERTDPNYIVIDKHDMIATHALIFDTTNLYHPKLIFAMRITFESRAKIHKLRTPVQDLSSFFSSECQTSLTNFLKRKDTLIEVNSLFVDEDYSFKNSGLRLSDIGFTVACLQANRMGYNHFVCCPNEKYKAHRLVENIGRFDETFLFTHPIVQDPHMLILVEEFKKPYIKTVYESNRWLFDNALEVSPKNMTYKTIAQSLEDLADSNVTTIESWVNKKVG